jgi:hypothetical protein
VDTPDDALILTPDELASGEWISEAEVLARTGLTQQSLRQRRSRGTLTARPARQGAARRSDYHYLASQVAALVAPHTPSFETELEIALLRAEVRAKEIEALNVELDAARNEVARLKAVLSDLLHALRRATATPDSDRPAP